MRTQKHKNKNETKSRSRSRKNSKEGRKMRKKAQVNETQSLKRGHSAS